MKRILTAVAAAALLTGCGAAVEATTPTPQHKVVPYKLQTLQPIVDAPPAECQEDEPCWDCLTMGNKICGPQPGDEVEAWTSLDPTILPTGDKPFKVEYAGKALAGIDFPPAEILTIPSTTPPNTVHVFEVQVGTPAAPPAPAPAPVDRCEEDEPCWDCATMGNLTCGTPAVAPVPTTPPKVYWHQHDAVCDVLVLPGHTGPACATPRG